MNRRLLVAASLVAVLSLSSAALAQPGRGPGRFGGGFGGGSLEWLQLLRSEEVQKEIELVDDQREQLRKIGEEAQAQLREGFGGGDFRDLSEEERRQRFAQLAERRQALEKDLRKKVEEVLLPHQVERLKQISLQARGAAALADPQVAEELGLTASQKEQLQEIQGQSRERMRELFQGGDGQAGDRRQQFEQVRKEASDKALAVLTPEQRQKFEKMQGEKFDVSQIERGFGGRGGRRPGGRDN